MRDQPQHRPAVALLGEHRDPETALVAVRVAEVDGPDRREFLGVARRQDLFVPRGERSRALDILEQAWGERPVPPRDA
jgi:hypothetical protein